MAANADVLAYLIEGAKRRGIDPATVQRAFGHEGLNVFDPGRPDLGGDEGSSFGPFQLHYAGMSKSMPNAGMGDDFTRSTGLHASDPSTWKAQTDYVLDYLANGGTWKPWMGAAAEGITGRMGLPGGGAVPVRPNATSPQMAADMASPGNPAISTPRQTGGVQGPPMPPDIAAQQSEIADNAGWRKKLAKMVGGYKPPAIAKSDTGLEGLKSLPAARVDTPEIAPFDQNQVAQQRQNLAVAMQRLNSGKLWL